VSRAVSSALKAATFAQQTDTAFITLLTITNANLATPIRVCDDPNQMLPLAGVRGVISRGDEYIFLPFAFSLPAEDDTGIGRAKLTIDNISREIVQAVRQAIGSKISLKIEIVLSSDLNTPEVIMSDFILEGIKYDAFTVTGDVTVEYYDLEPFPARRFTPSDFPGIF
jgi:hypothetical protein